MAIQDGLAEGDHGFSINIASTSLSAVTVGTPGTTSVTIDDDDGMLQGMVTREAYCSVTTVTDHSSQDLSSYHLIIPVPLWLKALGH